MITPPPIQYASLGMWDTMILAVMALVVFGPRRLPEIGRQIGKLMYEVRKASNDFKFQMEEEFRKSEEVERQKKEAERQALAAPPQIEAISQLTASANGTPENSVSTETPQPLDDPYAQIEAYPHIQPPSTGEPIPAEPPNRMTAQTEPAAEANATEERASHD